MTEAFEASHAFELAGGGAETDEQLVLRACAGDDAAFGLLVERHSRRMFRLAWQMTRNESDADDAVQETFLRAYRQLRRFDARSKFSTWLYRICVNYTLDLIRVRGRQAAVLEAPRDDEEQASALERAASEQPDPERLLLSDELKRRVGAALARLSEGERAAFILRHYEGLGIDEIARVLGLRAGAAKNTVFRAVQKLRSELQPLAQRGPAGWRDA